MTRARIANVRRGAPPGEGATDPRAGVAEAPLTIGELATQSGVTPETIRYYEREGVVPEAAREGAGRYRRYGAADAERLRFIRRARDLGFSLGEVRELLALADGNPRDPCCDVNRIARAHLAQVDAKLAQLAALRTELDRVINACDGVVAVAECRILGALSGVT
ncbi:MAG: helix-turn-helix domain-containing protein [Gemmatimonadaceae bacterium]